MPWVQVGWVSMETETGSQDKVDARLSTTEKANLELGKRPSGSLISMDVIANSTSFVKLKASYNDMLAAATNSSTGASGTIVLRSALGKISTKFLETTTITASEFKTGSSSGVSGSVTVISALQWYHDDLQYKTRTVTYTNGIVTGLGSESAWNTVP